MFPFKKPAADDRPPMTVHEGGHAVTLDFPPAKLPEVMAAIGLLGLRAKLAGVKDGMVVLTVSGSSHEPHFHAKHHALPDDATALLQLIRG